MFHTLFILCGDTLDGNGIGGGVSGCVLVTEGYVCIYWVCKMYLYDDLSPTSTKYEAE